MAIQTAQENAEANITKLGKMLTGAIEGQKMLMAVLLKEAAAKNPGFDPASQLEHLLNRTGSIQEQAIAMIIDETLAASKRVP
jgi:hypothetical protein